MNHLIIGTRGSKMALFQANQVKDLLHRQFPEMTTELSIVRSEGDAFQGDLRNVGGKGAFVSALDQALLQKRVDIVVNCMKDIPNDSERTAGIRIGGVLPRCDIRDALISRSGQKLRELPPGTVIGTSSPRRTAQLKRLFPNLETKYFRGSADTRVRKLDEGEVDALLMALSGLERIGLQHRITEILSPETICPPLGAGIITIDTVVDNELAKAVAVAISDKTTFSMMQAERGFLNALRGDCFTACAGYSTVHSSGLLEMRAMLLSNDGSQCFESKARGEVAEAERIGANLAKDLLLAGGDELLSRS